MPDELGFLTDEEMRERGWGVITMLEYRQERAAAWERHREQLRAAVAPQVKRATPRNIGFAQPAAWPQAAPQPEQPAVQPVVGRLLDWAQQTVQRAVILPSPKKEEISVVKDDMAEKLANTFYIGCDPEFIVESGGQALNVSKTPYNVPKDGTEGYDHSGLVVEIRPKAARGSYCLVRRIRERINESKVLKPCRDFKWKAGAIFKPTVAGARTLTLGGHVHLDVPPPGRGGNQADHDLRMKALDRFTNHLEKMDILPLTESEERRKAGARVPERYGQFGDWREAGGRNPGENFRVEYRTMASWLYDPKVAYLCLTGAKLAAVSPQLALDCLKARSVSWKNMQTFFEMFKHKDVNAKRFVEKFGESPVDEFHADPTIDFKTAWADELSF